MKYKIIIASIFSILFFQSCSSTKNIADSDSIFWVSGFKTEASAGAGKMQVLNIHRGEDISNPNWENFYAPIDGFEFEEGYLQKISVREKKLNKNQVPADASAIKYTLVKVIDKQKDVRIELKGKWTLARLNDQVINRMISLPTMNIDLAQQRIAGNTGCNNYSGIIKKLTASQIDLSEIAMTRKMCANKNVEPAFAEAINNINSYEINGSTLNFFSDDGKKVLTFIKDESPKISTRLHDIWTAIRIDGNPINRMTPTPNMELNLSTMKVMGNNGCNNYLGNIQKVTESALTFGNISVELKMCREMDTADRFDKLINKTATYRLDGLNLMLYDENGKEILAFLKAD